MKIIGIVAEYNPFHQGHAYQIRKIRERFGEDCGIVCVMSGDFVQRGEPALFSKYARAEAAIRCGADLVLELPVQFSIASAERFATGAVRILGELGTVDALVFGSESGDLDGIEATVRVLLTETFTKRMKEILETGISYPAARSLALSEYLGEQDLTRMPNDTLGIEYVKAIRRFGYSMTPVPVRRVGAMHDQVYEGNLKSGSELRQRVKNGEDISGFVPSEALECYQRETAQGRGPVFPEYLETAILSRLRMLPLSAFAGLPDAAEGLEHRLFQSCRRETSLSDIYDRVKSKRYTHARIRRMTLCAALGITRQASELEPGYARVLALNSKGGKILRGTESTRSIAVISKPAMARQLPDAQQKLFEQNALAHDLYVLGYENREARLGEQDWMTSPVFVNEEL